MCVSVYSEIYKPFSRHLHLFDVVVTTIDVNLHFLLYPPPLSVPMLPKMESFNLLVVVITSHEFYQHPISSLAK